MHPDIRTAFGRILGTLPPPQQVLEVGQMQGEPALIDLPALAKATRRVAFGLQAGGLGPAFEVVLGNANDMSCFAGESFDLILCNSMLEHDPAFWLSLSEMRRVLRVGGHLVVGVPGYAAMAGPQRGLRGWARGLVERRTAAARAASAPTLGLHGYPSDYYRFSAAAVAEVFLAGFDACQVEEVLDPPRFIGVGCKRDGV